MIVSKPSAIALVSLSFVAVASCGQPTAMSDRGQAVENAGQPQPAAAAFARQEMGVFDEPWALAFEPGTGALFITEKGGAIRIRRADGTVGKVADVPKVDYGGQGGLGDFAFGPDYAQTGNVYLSWAEAGSGDTRGAVVGKAKLTCAASGDCALGGLKTIWRQNPKVTGRGHYSHRIAFSPDGQYLFVASGDRQKGDPAQDLSNNLGTIVRLDPDGDPATGNPFAEKGPVGAQIWSYGHRNILGLAFDAEGRLWDLEHGPKGGDELNLVTPGTNYGWPVVSNGVNYDGSPIPDHATRPEFAPPAIWWDPVIAPGNMIFYAGTLFPGWQGDAIISGLASEAIVRVTIDGDRATETARFPMGARIRAVAAGPDGAIWAVEDGEAARLWRLTPGR